jgi:hypothetical protein
MAHLTEDQLEQPVSRLTELLCGAALLVLGVVAIAVGFSWAISDNPRGLWALAAFGFALAALGLASVVIAVRLLLHRARRHDGGLLSPGALRFAGVAFFLASLTGLRHGLVGILHVLAGLATMGAFFAIARKRESVPNQPAPLGGGVEANRRAGGDTLPRRG